MVEMAIMMAMEVVGLEVAVRVRGVMVTKVAG
jgi:hypothetical protein